MTPLAARWAKELTIPRGRRTLIDGAEILPRLGEYHFFAVEGVIELCYDLLERLQKRPEHEQHDVLGKTAFLPAERTWLERAHFAYLLEQKEEEYTHFGQVNRRQYARVLMCNRQCSWSLGEIELTHDGIGIWVEDDSRLRFLGDSADIEAALITLYGILALINTPNIIGRRQHMPHRGLQRRLTQALGAGRFPLRAWTEIKLEVAKPIEIDDGEPHEAHLTGRRALHFCRKHIRIRRGRLEYVSGHWRGDPAIGIKQSRYSAELPPQQGIKQGVANVLWNSNVLKGRGLNPT